MSGVGLRFACCGCAAYPAIERCAVKTPGNLELGYGQVRPGAWA